MVKFLYYGLSKQLQSICNKSSNKKRLKQWSNQIKTIASNKGVCSMSLIQIDYQIQYFAVLNSQYLKPGQWRNYDKLKPAMFKGILNVQIKDKSQQLQQNWQQCSSYPGVRMLITRPKSIKLQYMDESLKDYKEQCHGFQALIFQHEIDHLLGHDYIQKCNKVQIIDQKLKQKHQSECDELVQKYCQSKKSNNQSQQANKRSLQYLNKLKQFITYSIIDNLKNK